MESLLFDWSGWDRQDTMAFTFYDAVLKVDLSLFNPKLTKGATFDFADINYADGTVEFSVSPDEETGLGEEHITLKLGFIIHSNTEEENPSNTVTVLNTLVKE